MGKFSAILVAAVFTVVILSLLEVEGAKKKKKQPPPDDVYYQRNSTCTKRNSRRKAKPFAISSTTKCRCSEKNWMRCAVRGSTPTTTSPAPPPDGCNPATSKVACKNMTGCNWYEDTCRNNCYSYPTEPCPAHCAIEDKNENICGPKCSKITTEPNCLATDDCYWDSQSKSCGVTCRVRFRSVCENLLGCEWKNQACGVQCARIKDQNVCSASSDCLWSGTSCTPKCANRADKTVCQQVNYCSWVAGECVTACSSTTTSNCTGPCAIEDTSTGNCGPACSKITVEPDCSTTDGCMWDSGSKTCGISCTQNPADKPSCEARTGCAIYSSDCSTSCRRASNEADCNALQNCEWDTQGTFKCLPKCAPLSGTSATPCQNTDGCVAAQNATAGFSCSIGTDCLSKKSQVSCEAYPGCTWNAQTSACDVACSELTMSTDCDRNAGCAWNSTTQCNPK